MGQTGCRSLTMVRRYIREASVLTDHGAAGVLHLPHKPSTQVDIREALDAGNGAVPAGRRTPEFPTRMRHDTRIAPRGGTQCSLLLFVHVDVVDGLPLVVSALDRGSKRLAIGRHDAG